MLLKKLEVYGFKSFADRTEFVFEPGLTAIVGPNGCGKSNVVDAIRWVLGEQSAKSLRGNEMLDVIFGGTATRKSLGYAEAALSIDNSSRRLPIDYDEVCVARRLYRSGESEYFLNKQPCRLKDIRELIMDTGIGMDAYSVIEQGKVDVLLQANAQDRRSIFEEAAGISKYKAKKKAALSKLERVDQDLLRLQDILQEVQKQIRSIERQAAKARRFKTLTEELRGRELALLLHEYHQISVKLAALNQELQGASQQRESLNTTSEQLDAEVTQKETEGIALEQRLAQLQAADSEAQARISGAETTITMNRDRIRELEIFEKRARADIEQATARITEIERELARLSAEANAAEQQIDEQQGALTEKQAQAHEAGQQAATLGRCLEEQRTAIVDTLQHRSSVQNDLANVTNGQRSLSGERHRLAARGVALRQELEQLWQKRQDLEGALETLRRSLDEQRAALARDRADQDRALERLRELTDQIHDGQVTLKSKESRHELLSDLEARCEGLEAGVKVILEEARREGSSLSGIRGLVADLIAVEFEHAPAIESILGDRVQAIVVHSVAEAKAAMAFLREQHKGRAAFLALDAMSRGGAPTVEPLPEGVQALRARELVRAAEGAEAVADRLLARAFIVQDLDAAVGLAATANGSVMTYATPRGELARSDGFVFGGNGQERAGVISRRSELRALEAEMTELRAQLGTLEQQKSEVTARLEQLRRSVNEAEARLTQAELSIARQSDELERVHSDVAEREEELEVGRSEIADIDGQLEELRTRQAALEGELGRLDSVEHEIKQAVSSFEEKRNGLVQRKAALDEEITELKIGLAQRRERCDSIKHAAAQQARSAQEQRELVTRTDGEIQQSIERREAAARTIGEKEEQLRTLVEQRDALRTEMGQLDSERNALREALEALRSQNRRLHAELQQLDEQIQQARLRINELQYELRSLEERARNDCEAALAELHTGHQEVEQDWTALRAEIEDLRRKRDAIGPVNLLAIQELEELQQRETFLSAQFNDITAAKQSLQEAIRKINHHSRKLFQETFDAVRANFQVLFRKLFGGGKADIFLEPDQDVLEAGVEIIARPPGKEPLSITLLSGGEKVLTATALLFAVFCAKPSPFCVLDEVDAALDEKNIDRFVLMLREFLEHSQFIVITHSKRTMSLADALYGVTMQEAGVSRKVSVKFTNAGDGEHIAEEKVEDEAVVVG